MTHSRTKHVSQDTFNEVIEHLFDIREQTLIHDVLAYVQNAHMPQLRLYFHTAEHAIDVAYSFLKIWTQKENPLDLRFKMDSEAAVKAYKAMLDGVLACLLHDVFYIPGAGHGMNETASALVARRLIPLSWGGDQNTPIYFSVESICSLIETTANYDAILESEDDEEVDPTEYDFATYLRNCVLDADLSSLAHPVLDDYESLQLDIIREFNPEMSMPPTREAWEARLEWLKQNIFNRHRVFRTEWAHFYWERQARNNLEFMIASKVKAIPLARDASRIKPRGLAAVATKIKAKEIKDKVRRPDTPKFED